MLCNCIRNAINLGFRLEKHILRWLFKYSMLCYNYFIFHSPRYLSNKTLYFYIYKYQINLKQHRNKRRILSANRWLQNQQYFENYIQHHFYSQENSHCDHYYVYDELSVLPVNLFDDIFSY